MVKQYYEAFDMSDFNTMRTLLNDSISITSGDYVTTYSHTSFYEFFKWDSVLRTRKKLLNVESSDNDILATVSYSSMRYEFLKNNHLTCQYKINFKEDKISSFEELDCPNADWQVWEKQVNSLVEWTKTHHPELDGFIYDLTMQGALNYLKAMELYKNREIDL
ncbi:hypothetical protein [Allomuricauda sp. d1]|uniref:hypothetical protein n=1 Tax=Allomuricauda sp. d1 TaxID=3136725 RepID=UPI0031E31872